MGLSAPTRIVSRLELGFHKKRSKANSAFGVMKMFEEVKDVVEVRVVEKYRLFLRFEDGKAGEIDLETLIKFEGIFEPLKKLEYFATVTVDPELGTICWDNGADISPEFLYINLKSDNN